MKSRILLWLAFYSMVHSPDLFVATGGFDTHAGLLNGISSALKGF